MSGGQIGALAVAAVLVFWMVGAYNRLVALRSAIGAAWAQLDEPLQRRRAAIEALVTAIREVLGESEAHALDSLMAASLQVQAAADAMRARPVLALNAASMVQAEAVLVNAYAHLLAVLEHHPSLRDEASIAAQRQAMQEIEPRLQFARQVFNDAAQAYNEAARQFPTRVLTRVYGFGTAGRL